MKDELWHVGMRNQLVGKLRAKGISDERVLKAIGKIPRHFFLDKAFEEWAYRDQAFPIGHEQTISQPYTVAYQTELLKVEKRMKVLEIGTGSGYQAAVLSEIGARVFTIERIESLYLEAQKRLTEMDYLGIRFYLKDGAKGLADQAPFDRIIITAAASGIPQKLVEQLKVGGHLVAPVGQRGSQQMVRLTRLSAGKVQRELFDFFRFVPMLSGISRKST